MKTQIRSRKQASGAKPKRSTGLQALIDRHIHEVSSSKVCRDPLISVGLVTYNHAPFIAQAVESVISQEIPVPFEIVISDDFSTDGTRAILKDYQRRYPDKIRLILADRNLWQAIPGCGTSPTCNIAILAACRGKYIALLEGDDYWISKDKLRTQFGYLESHPKCSLCFHSVQVLEEGVKIALPPVFPPEDWPERSSTVDLLQKNFIHSGSVMYRRACLRPNIAWLNPLQLGDWPRWILLSLRGYVGHVGGIMGVYRSHSGGIWASHREKALRATIQMFETLEVHLPDKFLPAIRSSLAGFQNELSAFLHEVATREGPTPLPPGGLPQFQVFVPQKNDYHEAHSDRRHFRPGLWQRVQINLPRGLGDGTGPLRLDPGNKIGMVDIAAVSLRSAGSGELVLRLKTRDELARLTFGGTAIDLPHDRLLRLLSFGEDPQLFLPPLQGPQFNGPLVLEVWIRLDSSPRFLADSLEELRSLRISADDLQGKLAAQEKEHAELQAQLEILKRDHRHSQDELAARENAARQMQEDAAANERHRSQLVEELAARKKERDQLLEELAARAKERAQLVEELAARAKERDQLLEELAATKNKRDQLLEELVATEKERGQLREELSARETERGQLREELSAREKERGQLLEKLSARETERGQLLEELAAREMECGQSLRRKIEEEVARSLLQQGLAERESETAELHGILGDREIERRRLYKEIETLTDELESSRRSLWEIKARRAEATARLNNREESLKDIQNSLAWKIVKPIWKLQESRRRTKGRVKIESNLAFAIDLPESWETRSESVLIKGWCFDPSGRQIVGVRAKIGHKSYLARYGLERTDVMDTIGHGSTSLFSGFTIECSVPLGVTHVSLEAIAQGDDWRLFFKHELLREARPLTESLSGQESASIDSDQQATVARRKIEERLDLLRPGFERHALTAGTAIPRFSVITPTFNSHVSWLCDAARSLLSQSLPDWEWCIVDDGSTSSDTIQLLEGLADISPHLRVRLAKKNAGISSATNEAIALASGKYVCFMDHDDFLDPTALETLSSKMDEGFDVVYSDEDKFDDASGQFIEPFFKPDWSPEYFRGVMYVGHLLTVRRILAHKIGFDRRFDGVQDFEFMLRLSEATSRIGHVPKILYHWRKVAGSVADKNDAKPGLDLLQKQAVDAHLERLGLPAVTSIQGGHRLRMRPLRKPDPPNISILIPTKDAPLLIGRCLESIYQQTTYPNFQVIVVDNGTTDVSALDVMRSYPILHVDFPGAFNFSRANNMGSRQVSDGFLVCLNNDTEVITPDWLEHLLYYAEQPDVGAVGPLLLYDDRTVQHAGVALGMRGTADHLMRRFPSDVDGYAGSLTSAREVSAVTAACLMMSKSAYDKVGGFNEYFGTAYQDVDLCLRLRERGMRIVYTPQAVLIHHESASRKDYYDMVDRMFLLDQWETVIGRGDPYYNPNFDLERGDYSLIPR